MHINIYSTVPYITFYSNTPYKYYVSGIDGLDNTFVPVKSRYTNEANKVLLGTIIYDTSTNKMLTLTNNGWYEISSNVSMTSTSTLTEILAWASDKMKEERTLCDLAEKHPTLAGLLDKKMEIESQIKMVKALVQDAPHQSNT